MSKEKRRFRAAASAAPKALPLRDTFPETAVAIIFGLLSALAFGLTPERAKWVVFAVAVAVALLDWARRLREDKELSMDVADAIFAGMIGYGVLSLLWTDNANGGIQAIIVATSCLLFAAYLKRYLTARIMTAIAIGVGIGVLLAMASNIWIGLMQWSGFGNRGYAGEAFTLAIPFMWPLWQSSLKPLKLFAAFIVLACLAAILLVRPPNSAVSEIPLFVATVWLAIASIAWAFRRPTIGWAVTGLWGVLPLVGAWALWTPLQLTSRLLLRTELWLNTALMWKDRPLFGFGSGSFVEIFPLYKEAHGDLLPFVNHSFESYVTEAEAAHNEFLQLAAELGLIGLAAAVVMLALTLRAAAQRWRVDRLAAAGGMILVTALAESLLEYPLQRCATLFLAVLGLGLAGYGQSSGLRRWRIRLPALSIYAVAVAAAAMAGLLVYGSYRQFMAEKRYDQASLPNQDSLRALNAMYDGFLWDPLERRIRTALPVDLDAVLTHYGQKSIQQATIDQIYGWVENGGRYNSAALVAHCQLLLNRDQGNDPEFPKIFADLKRGSARVAAVYAIQARYQTMHGEFEASLRSIAEGKKYTGYNALNAVADDAIQANLDSIAQVDHAQLRAMGKE